LWKVSVKAGEFEVQTGLERVIPGDIIYYSGHVMMVADVEYEPGTRDTTVSQIRIIEATTWEVFLYRNFILLIVILEE